MCANDTFKKGQWRGTIKLGKSQSFFLMMEKSNKAKYNYLKTLSTNITDAYEMYLHKNESLKHSLSKIFFEDEKEFRKILKDKFGMSHCQIFRFVGGLFSMQDTRDNFNVFLKREAVNEWYSRNK